LHGFWKSNELCFNEGKRKGALSKIFLKSAVFAFDSVPDRSEVDEKCLIYKFEEWQ